MLLVFCLFECYFIHSLHCAAVNKWSHVNSWASAWCLLLQSVPLNPRWVCQRIPMAVQVCCVGCELHQSHSGAWGAALCFGIVARGRCWPADALLCHPPPACAGGASPLGVPHGVSLCVRETPPFTWMDWPLLVAPPLIPRLLCGFFDEFGATPISSIPTQPYHPFHSVPGASWLPKTFPKQPFIDQSMHFRRWLLLFPPNASVHWKTPALLLPISAPCSTIQLHLIVWLSVQWSTQNIFLAAVCLFPDVCGSFSVKYFPPSIFSPPCWYLLSTAE